MRTSAVRNKLDIEGPYKSTSTRWTFVGQLGSDKQQEVVAAYIAAAMAAGNELCVRRKNAPDEVNTQALLRDSVTAVDSHIRCTLEQNPVVIIGDGRVNPSWVFGLAMLDVKSKSRDVENVADALIEGYRDLAIRANILTAAKHLENSRGMVLPTETANLLIGVSDQTVKSWPKNVREAMTLAS